jgi:hypothetical protein
MTALRRIKLIEGEIKDRHQQITDIRAKCQHDWKPSNPSSPDRLPLFAPTVEKESSAGGARRARRKSATIAMRPSEFAATIPINAAIADRSH